MKYSENLPKISYETSIGKFNITNFFSYYKFNFNNTIKQTITVDSKTTLVEASATTYNDANSFWLILLANKTINPFTLAKPNTTLFADENEQKSTSLIIDRTTGLPVYMKEGSLVAPFSNTGGNPYDYSYIGNFDLDGDFYLVESQSFYTKKILVKANPTTGAANSFTSPVGGTSYNYIDQSSISSATESVLKNTGVKNVSGYLSSPELFDVSGSVVVEEGFNVGGKYDEEIAQSEDAPAHVGAEQTQTTVQELINKTNKNINIFDSQSIGKVTRKLSVIKYS